MSMVRIEQLSKYFNEGSQQRQVLDAVNACVDEGEFVALLGRSGSGKSTLLNLISG
ncbi:MAG: ATP-binding cassette domain-containing protein, partial [Anaerolineales bacterium]|nr:ATP-binding cassette domain-containing protein [Anaerolineales bacterium]